MTQFGAFCTVVTLVMLWLWLGIWWTREQIIAHPPRRARDEWARVRGLPDLQDHGRIINYALGTNETVTIFYKDGTARTRAIT